MVAMSAAPSRAFASSWSPTLLVNTEAFQVIDDGDGSTDIELRFGTTGNELKFNVTTNLFEFDAGVEVAGTASGRTIHAQDLLTTSGSLVVEEGEVVSFNGVQYLFPGSDGTDGFVLTTDSNGNLSWTNKTAGSLTTSSADNRYLKLSGGTVTGAVLIDVGDGNEANTPDSGLSFEVVGTLSGSKLSATDALSSSGSLDVDGDSFLDGEVTFGSGIIINGVTYRFPFGDGSASGKVLATDGNGNLSWTDSSDNQSLFETFAVSGQSDVVADSATDTLTFAAGSNVTITTDAGTDTITIAATDTSQATTFTLSGDGGSDQTISHGNTLEIAGGASITTTASATDTLTVDITDDTVNFTELADALSLDAATTVTLGTNNFTFDASSTGQFEILGIGSGRIFHAQDELRSSGTLVVDGAATLNSTLTLTSLTSCSLLTTNSNGQLVCDSEGLDESVDDRVNSLLAAGSGITLSYDDTNNRLTVNQNVNSGAQVSLSPEYAGAVYSADGSNNVGQLVLEYDSTNKENYYKWTSTQSSLQDYDIAVRVKVPDEFVSWDGDTPIEFRYRTNAASSADNQMDVTMLDTAGSAVSLTGGADLANTSWTTATITGPESTGTFTPGSYFTVLIKMQARTTNSGEAHAGYLNFNWATRPR